MIHKRLLDDQERVSWLQLSLSENVGAVTFKSLIERYATASNAIAALPDLARRGGSNRALKLYSRSAAEDDISRAKHHNSQFVVAGEQGYPDSLRHIHGAPPILCVSGRLELAHMPAVAVVGARNASAIGLKFTRMIAQKLVDEGMLVVSGLARGIDTAAHEAAIDKQTLAVVAGGIEHIYPPENEALQRRIAVEGLLVTEMVPGTAPRAEHFPRRNRIISGISKAIIVVEAALRSGSLITARLAAEQGREVFAVPGSPLDPRAQGCNKLIKDGAQILTSIEDVIEAIQVPHAIEREIFLERDSLPHYDSEPTQDERERVLELLSPTPTDLDDIIRPSGLAPELVVAILLELEIAGRCSRLPGNQVAIAAD